MPKLNNDKAAAVKAAGEADSLVLPEGLYKVKLTDVESKESGKGKPMWVWKFKTVELLDDPTNKAVQGKEQWYFTVIQDNTLWDIDRVFASFEAEPDTDTDELIGDEIVVMISQEVATGGKRKGKMTSVISDFFTLEDGLAKVGDFEELPEGGSSEDPGF